MRGFPLLTKKEAIQKFKEEFYEFLVGKLISVRNFEDGIYYQSLDFLLYTGNTPSGEKFGAYSYYKTFPFEIGSELAIPIKRLARKGKHLLVEIKEDHSGTCFSLSQPSLKYLVVQESSIHSQRKKN